MSNRDNTTMRGGERKTFPDPSTLSKPSPGSGNSSLLAHTGKSLRNEQEGRNAQAQAMSDVDDPPADLLEELNPNDARRARQLEDSRRTRLLAEARQNISTMDASRNTVMRRATQHLAEKMAATPQTASLEALAASTWDHNRGRGRYRGLGIDEQSSRAMALPGPNHNSQPQTPHHAFQKPPASSIASLPARSDRPRHHRQDHQADIQPKDSSNSRYYVSALYAPGTPPQIPPNRSLPFHEQDDSEHQETISGLPAGHITSHIVLLPDIYNNEETRASESLFHVHSGPELLPNRSSSSTPQFRPAPEPGSVQNRLAISPLEQVTPFSKLPTTPLGPSIPAPKHEKSSCLPHLLPFGSEEEVEARLHEIQTMNAQARRGREQMWAEDRGHFDHEAVYKMRKERNLLRKIVMRDYNVKSGQWESWLREKEGAELMLELNHVVKDDIDSESDSDSADSLLDRSVLD